jgi:hypothetical protein
MNDFEALTSQARQDDRIAASKAFNAAKAHGIDDAALEMFIATNGPLDVMTFETNELVRRDLFGDPDKDGRSSSAIFTEMDRLIEAFKLLIDNNQLALYESDDGQLVDIPSRVGMLIEKSKPIPSPSEVRHMGADGALPPGRIEGPVATAAGLLTAGVLGLLTWKWWQSRG